MEELELLHDMFAHGRITFSRAQQMMNLLVWMGGNEILTLIARRDQEEPAEGENSAPTDRAGHFEEKRVILTNNEIIGDNVTTGQTHARANPIYQERRHRTSTSFHLSTMRSTGKPAKGIQPCGKQPNNPTCIESKRNAEAKLRRKKPLRAMEAMIQRKMVGRSTTAESQTHVVQAAEAGIREVAEKQINGTETELSDRMLRNRGVHRHYWEMVRKSNFVAEATQGILPTDDEVMRSMNQTVDSLLTHIMPEEEETLGEETRCDLHMFQWKKMKRLPMEKQQRVNRL